MRTGTSATIGMTSGLYGATYLPELGRAGESWGELGRAGESWGELGRAGESWGQFRSGIGLLITIQEFNWLKEALYRIWCCVSRLGDSGVNRLGDTSAFVNRRVSYC